MQHRLDIPPNKSLLRRCLNRAFAFLARLSPGGRTLRPMLHRARGIKIGRDVFIGDDVYFDAEYPESIEIKDRVEIIARVMILAHTRGPGKVIIEKEAFVGAQAIIACSAGRTLRIGEGAVVGAGCVVTKNVPSHAVLTPAPPQVTAQAAFPLTMANTIEEF